MTPHQIAQKGIEAQRVLESEVYKEAMSAMKAQIVEQWKAAPIRDVEGQRLLLQLAKLADKFDGILSGLVQGGKLAQHQIDLDGLRDESKARTFFRRVA